jgi:hypothetical protein
LISGIMSLLYGCLYIIRFGTMRKMHKASTFAMVGVSAVSCARSRARCRKLIRIQWVVGGIYGSSSQW